MKGTAVGPAKLTVEASGFKKVFEIVYVKKAILRARFIAARPRFTASAGERAGGNKERLTKAPVARRRIRGARPGRLGPPSSGAPGIAGWGRRRPRSCSPLAE
jgi:hypothetical protein